MRWGLQAVRPFHYAGADRQQGMDLRAEPVKYRDRVEAFATRPRNKVNVLVVLFDTVGYQYMRHALRRVVGGLRAAADRDGAEVFTFERMHGVGTNSMYNKIPFHSGAAWYVTDWILLGCKNWRGLGLGVGEGCMI